VADVTHLSSEHQKGVLFTFYLLQVISICHPKGNEEETFKTIYAVFWYLMPEKWQLNCGAQ
jgi:hypothetical protein